MPANAVFRAAIAAAGLALAATSHAALFRAYVSVDGSDANPCTLPQPCRLLPAAIGAVAAGGEVWILDSGNFNTAPVDIAKSVTIRAIPGVVGSVVTIGGPAIRITTAGLKVSLRNMVVAPFPGTVEDGIYISANSTLSIEDSVIANVGHSGVRAYAQPQIYISDSVIRDNSQYGVIAEGGPQVTISGTRLSNNLFGAVVAGSGSGPPATRIAVSDCVISGGGDGIWAVVTFNGGASVTVTRSTVERTANALKVQSADNTGTATITLSYSTVANNQYAWRREGTGASYRTLGNNHFIDNGNPVGTSTPVALQ